MTSKVASLPCSMAIPTWFSRMSASAARLLRRILEELKARHRVSHAHFHSYEQLLDASVRLQTGSPRQVCPCA